MRNEKENRNQVSLNSGIKEAPTAEDFLNAGLNILGERGEMRDTTDGQKKERSMDKIVHIFNLLYNQNLTVEQGWAFMVVLKQVRAATRGYDKDSIIDEINYIALMGEASALYESQTKFIERPKETK